MYRLATRKELYDPPRLCAPERIAWQWVVVAEQAIVRGRIQVHHLFHLSQCLSCSQQFDAVL
jgi:hypothetical protein